MADFVHLGALTTTFTPPASCYSLTVSSDSGTFWTTDTVTGTDGSVSSSSYTTLMTPMWYEMFDYALDTSCYPAGDRAMRTEAYYSPGICPHDWTTVQKRTRNGETTANCCPAGFTIDTSLCRSSIRVTTTEAILYYQETRVPENPQTFTVTANDIIWASGVEVRFRDGDFGSSSGSSSSETSASETSVSSTSNPTGDDVVTTTVPAPGPTGDSQAATGGGGLSNGAKIGIGIGVPLVAIAAGALAFLLWWRRRRAKTAAADGALAQPTEYSPGPPGAPQMVMAGGPPVYDTNGNQYPAGTQPGAYGDAAYKTPAAGVVPVGGAYYKPEDNRRASEMYAPGAHGGFAQNHGQRPLSEAPGSSPNQSYTGVSPGGLSPHSGVSPAGSPPQFQAQPQGYQAYAPVHEVSDNQVVMGSSAGPLPDHHELYPEMGDENRRH